MRHLTMEGWWKPANGSEAKAVGFGDWLSLVVRARRSRRPTDTRAPKVSWSRSCGRDGWQTSTHHRSPRHARRTSSQRRRMNPRERAMCALLDSCKGTPPDRAGTPEVLRHGAEYKARRGVPLQPPGGANEGTLARTCNAACMRQVEIHGAIAQEVGGKSEHGADAIASDSNKLQ